MSKLPPYDEPHGDMPNQVAVLKAENARLRGAIQEALKRYDAEGDAEYAMVPLFDVLGAKSVRNEKSPEKPNAIKEG